MAASGVMLGGVASAAGAPSTAPATEPTVVSATVTGLAPELEQPMLILAGGKLIDAHHAAPFFGDVEGKGRKDLLIGQFDEGKLRIYKNVGSNEKPRFDDYAWFRAGAEVGKIPAG